MIYNLIFYSNEFEKTVILEDFNLEPSSSIILYFMDCQNFVNLIKYKTCFKAAGSRIDLILTNRKSLFKNKFYYEDGLKDHHRLIYSVMKTTFKCEEPKKLIYKNYSSFSQKDFQSDLVLNIGDGKNI